jgi:hypothetical protein
MNATNIRMAGPLNISEPSQTAAGSRIAAQRLSAPAKNGLTAKILLLG